MPETVWERAGRLQRQINSEIDRRCLLVTALEYQTVAEATINEVLDPEEWEWLLRYGYGDPPHVFITRYLKFQLGKEPRP